MKSRVLGILREKNDYTSGQSICNTLNISRTAVWKYINQLKEEGYVISAVSNKGYFISQYPDVVTKVELKSLLKTKFVGTHVDYYSETDSTNNQAKIAAEAGAAHGTLIVAETQSSGRGRRGHNWTSPSGSGVWMSLILRPHISPYSAPMMTLVTALAAAQAIGEITSKKCQIKWPNDIILNQKKVCGILTEMSCEADAVNYVVVGIGINVNIPVFEEELTESATSLLIETGQVYKRSDLINIFSKYFEKYYDIFMKTMDMSQLMGEYNGLLINQGREVKICGFDDSYTAISEGINDRGELLVKKQDGQLDRVIAGEVSVRGLYGYV